MFLSLNNVDIFIYDFFKNVKNKKYELVKNNGFKIDHFIRLNKTIVFRIFSKEWSISWRGCNIYSTYQLNKLKQKILSIDNLYKY